MTAAATPHTPPTLAASTTASKSTRPTRGRSIRATMERLRLASVLPLGGSLDRPLDAREATAPLHSGIETIRSAVGAASTRPPSPATLAQAIAAWAQHRPDLDALAPRLVRALCTHAPTVRDPAFVAAVGARPDLRRRRRWVESLVAVYEAEWRPTPVAEALERLLLVATTGFEARSARLDRIRAEARRYFSADAADWIASNAIERREAVPVALTRLGTPLDSALARAAAIAAASAWVVGLTKHRVWSGGVAADLEYGLTQLLSSSLVSGSILAEAVEHLIAWVPEERDDAVARVRDWLLSDAHFGDPRLNRAGSLWSMLPDSARARVIRWLAKGDLLFFFDFVMDHVDDVHGRKEFWLRYIDQVEDSAVALSPTDVRRLKLTVADQLRYARADSPTEDVSAFLMRFRGTRKIVVAEFSQVGNAAYVHDAERFDQHVGGLRKGRYGVSTDARGLKSRAAMITKYSHVGTWEWRVANELAHHGVRRG